MKVGAVGNKAGAVGTKTGFVGTKFSTGTLPSAVDSLQSFLGVSDAGDTGITGTSEPGVSKAGDTGITGISEPGASLDLFGGQNAGPVPQKLNSEQHSFGPWHGLSTEHVPSEVSLAGNTGVPDIGHGLPTGQKKLPSEGSLAGNTGVPGLVSLQTLPSVKGVP